MTQPAIRMADQPSMKPRSVILDLFGDYLRYGGSEVKAGDLVALLGAFGFEEATVRMTLSRLRKEEWFTTRRVGRETVYALSDHMLEVLDEGRERIFAGYDDEWDRIWTTVIHQIERPDRLVRDRLRRELAWQGFGPLSSSTWLAPRSLGGRVAALSEAFPEVRFTIMRSQTGSVQEDREIVARCWDLASIDDAYRDFLAAYSGLAEEAPSLQGVDALVARTTLIAAYRHFPFSDPWLPVELRPHGWRGREANELFRATHFALRDAADAFVAGVIGRPLDAPLI